MVLFGFILFCYFVQNIEVDVVNITLERILQCIGTRHGAAKELADALGINPQIITNWKCGNSRSYRNYIPEIAEHFGVSVEYLLGNEKKETPTDVKAASDEELKFALFGDVGVSDEDFEDVKRFAEFIKNKKKE